jgi:hypothetical protein
MLIHVAHTKKMHVYDVFFFFLTNIYMMFTLWILPLLQVKYMRLDQLELVVWEVIVNGDQIVSTYLLLCMGGCP